MDVKSIPYQALSTVSRPGTEADYFFLDTENSNKLTRISNDGTVTVYETAVGLFDLKGNFDATSPNLPAASKGDVYIVSVAGTVNGLVLQINDMIVAKVDTAAGQAANWEVVQGNLEIASQAEAEAGVNNDKYMTPLRVLQSINFNQPLNIENGTGTDSWKTQVTEGGKNPNTVAGKQAAAVGWDNTVSGDGAFANGNGNVASGMGAWAGGNAGSTASGESSFAFDNSIASARGAFAMGNDANATQANAFAFGTTVTASGVRSMAFGNSVTVAGNGGFGFGYDINNVAGAAIAWGEGAGAGPNGQIKASGAYSRNFSRNSDAAQNYDCSGQDSGIFGGTNHRNSGVRSVVLGGTGQNCNENDTAWTQQLRVVEHLKMGAGANQVIGEAVLAAGTSGPIANDKVTAGSFIFLSRKTIGGAAGNLTVIPGAGTFTINSDNAGDTSTVIYMIANP